MPADQPRTRTVGCKMTDSEYERLSAVAEGDGMTLGEWVREVLLERADGRKPSVIEETLLAETLALRTILLNLHFTVAKGETITAEGMQAIIDRADAGKAKKAASRDLIDQSLAEARRFYAPRATASWSHLFYQYANRLAHQYFLRQLNHLPSALVFLYFVNADDMLGPMSEEEWHGAVRLIHAALGLPKDLTRYGVFDAFLDARLLQDAA